MYLNLKKAVVLAVVLIPMVGLNQAFSMELVEGMDVENGSVTINQGVFNDNEMEVVSLLVDLEGSYNLEQQNQLSARYAQELNHFQQISQGGKNHYLADRAHNMLQQFQSEETLEEKWRLLSDVHQALRWIPRT